MSKMTNNYNDDSIASATSTIIDLSHQGIDPKDILEWSTKQDQNINNSSNIHFTVYLKYNNLGDTGCSYFSNYLKNDRSIICLDLSFNNIGDEGIKCICHSLSINRTLQVLDLSGNSISPQGFSYIAQIITTNQSIKSLYLAGNAANHIGIYSISEALTSHKLQN